MKRAVNIPFVLLTIQFFWGGCVSTGPAQSTSAEARPTPADAPLWVTDMAAVYPNSEWLCYVAIGEDKRLAENAAIAGLARNFDVNIQETISDNQRFARVIDNTGRKKTEVSSASEKIAQELTSSTSVNGLMGVQMDTWAAADGRVYVIARMNRKECSARYAALISESENLIEYLKAEAEKYPGTPDAVELLNAAYDAAQATDNFYRLLIMLDPSAAERRRQYGNAAMVNILAQNAARSITKGDTVNSKTAGLNQAASLDEAIRNAAQYLIGLEQLPKNSRVAFMNFTAPNPEKDKAVSDYILPRLESQCRDHFIIVDRNNIELRRQELALSLNMETSEETELAIGKMLSAQCIVTGSISKDDNTYTLILRPLITETGQTYPFLIEGISEKDRKLRSLLASGDSPDKNHIALLGVRAGLSPHFWTLSDDVNGDAESPASGFEPAVQGAFYITDWFAVQTELALSIDKVSYSGSEADGSAYTASFDSVSLRVPLLARFTFRPGIFVLSAFGGMSFNIPLGDMKLHSNVYDDSSYRFSIPPGYVAGVNAGIKLGPGILFADARFSGDFDKTVINDNSGTLALYTRNTLSFSLGYEWEFFLNRQK